MRAMTGRVLARAKDGKPQLTEYSETAAERRARIRALADDARRRFNLTAGQRDTLRRAAAARRTGR